MTRRSRMRLYTAIFCSMICPFSGSSLKEAMQKKKEIIPHICESIGHQPLWDSCPASSLTSSTTYQGRARVMLTTSVLCLSLQWLSWICFKQLFHVPLQKNHFLLNTTDADANSAVQKPKRGQSPIEYRGNLCNCPSILLSAFLLSSMPCYSNIGHCSLWDTAPFTIQPLITVA